MKLYNILIICLLFSGFASSAIAGTPDQKPASKLVLTEKTKNLIKSSATGVATLIVAHFSYNLAKFAYNNIKYMISDDKKTKSDISTLRRISNISSLLAGSCALAHYGWKLGKKAVNYYKAAK